MSGVFKWCLAQTPKNIAKQQYKELPYIKIQIYPVAWPERDEGCGSRVQGEYFERGEKMTFCAQESLNY
jgi:hypothetical protein